MSEFEIEVVFASSEKQALLTVAVSSGATVAEVVTTSGVLDQFPDQPRGELSFGIWGRLVEGDRIVKRGDRVELYRPLDLDPREARRQLATVGRTMGKVDSD
jgi:putative ubiquitin-RnfH superfamily antitoxin RatB of RatAB toxin-antitoxin module